MMTDTTAHVAVEKATGRRFVYEVKLSWDRHYYSFDRETWHTSKLEAFRNAQQAETLREAK